MHFLHVGYYLILYDRRIVINHRSGYSEESHWEFQYDIRYVLQERDCDEATTRFLQYSSHRFSSHLTSPFAGKAFKAGLSLGSGRGQFEHELVRIGVVRNILGVDISETRLSLPYVVNIVFFSTVTLLILIPVRIYTG